MRRGEWPVVLGYGFFLSMLAAGYTYNVTFVQLGLVDLGTRVVGLRSGELAREMSLLAVLTAATAVGFGVWMTRRGRGRDLVWSLRAIFVVVTAQAALTFFAPRVASPASFRLWIVLASVALGVGIPVTYGLAVHLVHRLDRGVVAAAVTAVAYPAAVLLSRPWRVEHLASRMLPVLVIGSLALAWLSLRPAWFVRAWALQHRRPEFGIGRFVRIAADGRSRVRGRFLAAVVMLFGIYFIDSLGFLRITATPVLVQAAWQSARALDLWTLSAYHVVGAAVAGILYGALSHRALFLWILATFALVHLGYVLHGRVFPVVPPSLAPAALYAFAVSMYTVVSLAIWPDLSTPRTAGLYTALGVALSGWAATFLSTALAVRWFAGGVSAVEHLDRVAAVALFLFAATVGVALAEAWRQDRVVPRASSETAP